MKTNTKLKHKRDLYRKFLKGNGNNLEFKYDINAAIKQIKKMNLKFDTLPQSYIAIMQHSGKLFLSRKPVYRGCWSDMEASLIGLFENEFTFRINKHDEIIIDKRLSFRKNEHTSNANIQFKRKV